MARAFKKSKIKLQKQIFIQKLYKRKYDLNYKYENISCVYQSAIQY